MTQNKSVRHMTTKATLITTWRPVGEKVSNTHFVGCGLAGLLSKYKNIDCKKTFEEICMQVLDHTTCDRFRYMYTHSPFVFIIRHLIMFLIIMTLEKLYIPFSLIAGHIVSCNVNYCKLFFTEMCSI